MNLIKWTLILFFTCLFSMTVFAQSDSSSTQSNNFPKTLNLNNQEWKLDYFKENEDVQWGEYVTNGENVNNWTQLFTIQNFKFQIKKDTTPSMFADKEIEQLKSEKYKIDYKKIESNDNEAIIEFRVTDPKDMQQDELQRIIITPDRRLIVVHFVTKKMDMGDVERKNWTNILRNFDLSFLKLPNPSQNGATTPQQPQPAEQTE